MCIQKIWCDGKGHLRVFREILPAAPPPSMPGICALCTRRESCACAEYWKRGTTTNCARSSWCGESGGMKASSGETNSESLTCTCAHESCHTHECHVAHANESLHKYLLHVTAPCSHDQTHTHTLNMHARARTRSFIARARANSDH